MNGGPLTRLLRERHPAILDGAMGTELERRGVNTGLPLWSAHALIARPDAVRQIHVDYMAAGADIITTDTFRTTRRIFTNAGLDDRSAELTQFAVLLALETRAAFTGRRVLVAGSIGPLEDCYRPDLVPGDAALRSEHAEHAERLVTAGVDLLLLETMGTVREAAAAAMAARATGSEYILSFLTQPDGRLYGGETLADAVRAVASMEPTAFAINCISPRSMEKSIEALRAAIGDRPFGVYANVGLSGREKERGTMVCDVAPEEYGDYGVQWIHAGAAFVGGCCGTTPTHIRFLATKTQRKLNRQGAKDAKENKY